MYARILHVPVGILLIPVLLFASAKVYAVEAVWIGGPSGNWSDPANWSTGVVPFDVATDVTIDGNPQDSSASTLGSTAGVGDIAIDTGDQLEIASGGFLTAEFVTVAGDLIMQPATQLRAREALWIQPNGHLSLVYDPAQSRSVVYSLSNPAFWNEGKVSGAGQIGLNMFLQNEGVIVGNIPGHTLSASLSLSSNNVGEMLATNGGSLYIERLNSAVLYNTNGVVDGLIQARHAGSLVTIVGLGIIGGEISTAADEDGVHGQVELVSSTLNDVELNGNIVGSRIAFQNIIENNATITNSDGDSLPFVSINSPATLSGTGRLEMLRGSIDSTALSNSDPYLVNSASHTIAGAGTIQADRIKFLNRGLVEAYTVPNDADFSLVVGATKTAVNSGIIRARDQVTMTISSSTTGAVFENFEGDTPGVIEAELNSTVRLQNVTLRGGVLRSITPAVEEPSHVAGRIVSPTGTNTILHDVRMEGPVGDATSTWRLTGEIENTEVLRAYELLIDQEVVLSGGGRVELGQGSSNTIIRGWTSPTLLVNQDNTISGTGVVDVTGYTFKNHGIVVAENSFSQLVIRGGVLSTFNNNGLLKATNGATLSLEAQVNNFEGIIAGTIHADHQSFVRVGDVIGGVLSTSGSGEIVSGVASGTSGLREVHNQGFLRISGLTEAVGTLRNDGTIVSDPDDVLRFSGAVVKLTGTGTVGGLQSSDLNLTVGQWSPTILMHGPQHTIRGRGLINVRNGAFVNQGTLLAEGIAPLEIYLAEGAQLQQQGTIMAPQGNMVLIRTFEEQFTNEGLMVADGTIQVSQQDMLPLQIINANDATFQGGTGTVVLAAQGANPLSVWNQQGGTISGGLSFNFSGINPDQPKLFRNSGLISPDGHHESQAHLVMNAEFVQDSTGTLKFDLGGDPSTGWFDSLTTELENISLAGKLEVSLAEGFEPNVGDSYELLLANEGAITGAFDTFMPTPMLGKWMSLEYLSDRVLLNINALTADFDGNGFVDTNDLDDWQAARQAGNALGDADGDGDSDGRDFLAWQRQYGSGIPVAGVASVPEPSTLLLLTLCGVWFPRRRSTQIFR